MNSKLEISRELLANFIEYSSPISSTDQQWHRDKQELRALLAQPYRVVCSNGILCQDRSCAECGGNGSIDIAQVPPLIQTLHANGDRIAMEATIAQQAQRIADLEAVPVAKEQNNFWSWLDSAYRNGSEGEQAKFTKYNMEVAYQAGLTATPVVERQEPVAWIVTDMNGDSYFAYDKQTPSDKPLYAEQPAQVAVDKYDDVLLPFLALMRAELHANAHKGDRPGWLQMDSKTAILEVFYHMGKLHQAVHRGEESAIKEYAADVANMSMMLVDTCGCLDKVKELNQ